MSKQKTRQQKIITQLHRKLEAQQLHSSESSVINEMPKKHISSGYTYTASLSSTAPSAHLNTAQLSYIQHDLFKTLTVTSAIIVAQLMLYYCLKTNIITLPIGKY